MSVLFLLIIRGYKFIGEVDILTDDEMDIAQPYTHPKSKEHFSAGTSSDGYTLTPRSSSSSHAFKACSSSVCNPFAFTRLLAVSFMTISNWIGN